MEKFPKKARATIKKFIGRICKFLTGGLVYAFLSMASEGLNLAAITFTLYRNVRFVIRNGYNEDALKVFPFLAMVVMASVFVS